MWLPCPEAKSLYRSKESWVYWACADKGDCQNYGPFLGPYYSTGPNTGPNLGDPKRDHNFDHPPKTLGPEHLEQSSLHDSPFRRTARGAYYVIRMQSMMWM